IPDITSRARNQPTLNVSPSPPVEIGELVLFEIVLWQPPPPGWNLQYRFDFGDGTQTDWISERQTTHTYSTSGNGSYPVHVEIASTYRDRVMPSKAIDKNVDVIPPSNPTPSATASAAITPSPSPITPSPPSTSTPIATAAPTLIPSITSIPPSPPPLRPSRMLWLYVAVGLAIAGLASFIYKKWKPKVVIAGPLAFYPRPDWDAPQKPPENVSINYGLYFHPNVSAGQDRLETDGASSLLRKKKKRTIHLLTCARFSHFPTRLRRPRLRTNGRSFKIGWAARSRPSNGRPRCPISLRKLANCLTLNCPSYWFLPGKRPGSFKKRWRNPGNRPTKSSSWTSPNMR